MRHITGISRQQLMLFPESLDEYISADNPVRFIESYLQELDELDQIEASGVPPQRSAEQLQAKIEQLKTRQGKYQGYLERMEESGESQLSLTDPDSRAMPESPKAPVAYNTQTAVDSKHNLIVAQDVTNDVTDRDQLSWFFYLFWRPNLPSVPNFGLMGR